VKSRNERSVIDYVLKSKINRTDIKDVILRRGTEIHSDHYLPSARIRMNSGRERKAYT